MPDDAPVTTAQGPYFAVKFLFIAVDICLTATKVLPPQSNSFVERRRRFAQLRSEKKWN
jgi:hypothetical protein